MERCKKQCHAKRAFVRSPYSMATVSKTAKTRNIPGYRNLDSSDTLFVKQLAERQRVAGGLCRRSCCCALAVHQAETLFTFQQNEDLHEA